jgi:F0F1-type ATP synthase delta subunit
MKQDMSIYFDLVTAIKTAQEVTDFTSEIDTLMLTFFKPENASIEKALDSISAEFAQKIIQTFKKNNLDLNNRDTFANFFKNLKEIIGKLEVIKLVLAFDPNSKTVEKIHNFVKENIGTGYILDIEVSQDLLGGSIVMFNGKYHDFSLKKTIEDTFETKKEEIIKFIQ